MDKKRLRQKIRNVIEAGTLPDRRPERMWGGPGSGVVCALCGETVTADQTELELEFVANEQDGYLVHHAHVGCFSLWEAERENRPGGPVSPGERSATGQGQALPVANARGTISVCDCVDNEQSKSD